MCAFLERSLPLLVLLLIAAENAAASSFRNGEMKKNGLLKTRSSIGSSSMLAFDDWMDLHEKAYPTHGEYVLRRAIYQQNQQVVSAHNRAYQKGWTLYALTMKSPFADLTADEFEASYLMEWQDCSATVHTSSGSVQEYLHHVNKDSSFGFHDNSVDWRTKGILTPVKSQGKCGSCWTFSTTGCLEAHACLAHGKDCTHWHGLAEQQLVDCADHYNNHGCNGGLPSQAFEYIQHSKHGLLQEAQYPYHANETGQCQVYDDCVDGIHVAEVFNITSQDEDDLVHAVRSIGPVSIAYQVSPDFRFYSHGIYDSYNATTNTTMCASDSQSVNHAVVAVGLGSTEATLVVAGDDAAHPSHESDEDSKPYYIVRNSWGTSWGMEGHFWMLRGENLCGVSDCASFPVVPVIDQEKVDNNENAIDEAIMARRIRG